jgi:arginine:agmatine antiporter
MKALGTLAGWVLLTGQVSRAAADHGLMPRIFARTRRGEIPVAGLVIAGVFGSLAIVLTVAPTLGQQFGLLSDAATVFNLLTYVAGCAAAIRYGARGELTLAVLGSLFCVYVIVESNVPVLKVAFLLMVAAALCYLPRAARKQRSADPAEP